MMPFKKFIETAREGRKFIAHCYDEVERIDLFSELMASPAGDVTILIGPEGDFSIDEVRLALEHGYESVTLGQSRFRTETAGLVSVVMAHLTKEIK